MNGEELGKLVGSVVRIPLKDLYDKFLEADEDEARRLARLYMRTTSSSVDLRGLVKAMKLHLAIKDIVEEYRLDAFTIECFEVIRVLGVSPCFSLAYHNANGIVAGCEGDVNGLATMMIASYVSGEPAFIGNLADIIDDNTAVLAHCTAPLNIGSYTLTTHFETGKPLGVSVTPPSGRPVTVLKLNPVEKELNIAEGVNVSSVNRPGMCRTQYVVRFKEPIEWMLRESPGNHYVVVLGDHVKRVEYAGELLGFRVVNR
jgi:L-fucose isomerase-like protein